MLGPKLASLEYCVQERKNVRDHSEMHAIGLFRCDHKLRMRPIGLSPPIKVMSYFCSIEFNVLDDKGNINELASFVSHALLACVSIDRHY